MKKIRYRDFPIMVVGSLLIAQFLIGLNNESFFKLIFYPAYYIDFLGVSVSVFWVWFAIRATTIRLDRKFAWEIRFTQRLFYQLLFGIGGMALLSLILAMVHFTFVIRQDIREGTFFVYEYPIGVMIIVLLNGYYFSYYHYALNRINRLEISRLKNRLENLQENTGSQQSDEETPELNPRTIIVSAGAHQIPLVIEGIRLAFKKGERVNLFIEDGNDYLISQTLEELEKRLPEVSFFRVNRQAIVHFKACKSFQSIENGKLKLILDLNEEPLIISQKRAPAFKKWLAEASH